MHIDVTFGGALTRHIPEGARGNRQSMKIVDGVTLLNFLSQIGISEDERLLVILNGKVIPKTDYTSTVLTESDNLSLMPPIQAG